MRARRDGARDPLTPLATTGIPKLLKPAADLLRGPSLSSDMIDVVRDKSIAIWEPAERSSGARCFWTVLVEG